MKMLVVVTDSEYEPHCMNMMREKGITGYTVIPDAYGVGKTGAKRGTRLHPGGCTLILAAIPDEAAPEALKCVRQCIADRRLCESTHAWILPVEAALKEVISPQ